MAWKIVTRSAIKAVDYRPQEKDHHCPVTKSILCRQQHNCSVLERLHIFHAVHKGIDHKGGFIERNIGLLCEVFDQFTLIHDFSEIRVPA